MKGVYKKLYFYDMSPFAAPHDAEYFFNITVINIGLRKSLFNNFKEYISDYWNIKRITESRPIVYHLYLEDDCFFEKEDNYIIELFGHSVVEISPTLGISFYELLEKEEEEEQEVEDFDLEDFWRI